MSSFITRTNATNPIIPARYQHRLRWICLACFFVALASCFASSWRATYPFRDGSPINAWYAAAGAQDHGEFGFGESGLFIADDQLVVCYFGGTHGINRFVEVEKKALFEQDEACKKLFAEWCLLHSNRHLKDIRDRIRKGNATGVDAVFEVFAARKAALEAISPEAKKNEDRIESYARRKYLNKSAYVWYSLAEYIWLVLLIVLLIYGLSSLRLSWKRDLAILSVAIVTVAPYCLGYTPMAGTGIDDVSPGVWHGSIIQGLFSNDVSDLEANVILLIRDMSARYLSDFSLGTWDHFRSRDFVAIGAFEGLLFGVGFVVIRRIILVLVNSSSESCLLRTGGE